MSGRTKKHLTNDDVKILVRGKEIELKKSVKNSFLRIIKEIVDIDSVSAKEIHGNWLNSARMRVAKYLMGARKREGFTQVEVCKKLGIQQSNLSSMERGDRPIPKDLIAKFAKLYNVNINLLSEKMVIKKLKA
jgi:ribosome-binding protein aMBF1 (putative translation factor)